MPSTGLPRLLALALLLTLPSCMFQRPRGVRIASDPPGARVVVDGRDSGFVTPCVLDLENEDHQVVELVRPGYEDARRVLVSDVSAHLMLWREMAVHYNTWNFPLWLNAEDFIVPIKIDRGPKPARIFVRMKRRADR